MTNYGYVYVKPRTPCSDIDTMRADVHNMIMNRLMFESRNNRILRETAIISVLAEDKYGVCVKFSSAAGAQEIRMYWRDDNYEFQRIRLRYPAPPDPDYARMPVGAFEYLPHVERQDAIQFDNVERRKRV